MTSAKTSQSTADKLQILLICASPRPRVTKSKSKQSKSKTNQVATTGISRQLTAFIAEAILARGAAVDIFALDEHTILPCKGCGACTTNGKCVIPVADDDNALLQKKLDKVAALGVISPIYFAGVPAQLKAAYDRLQTYWVREYVLGQARLQKRPAQLFVVGESGSPYGWEGLTLTTKSALAPAGFTLEKTLSFVGFDPSKIDPTASLPYKLELNELGTKANANNAKELIAAGVQSEFIQRAHDAGGALVRAAQNAASAAQQQSKLN